MQASEPRTEPLPTELPTVSDGIEPFGIRVHRPVPARVLRAHTHQILGFFLVLLSLSAVTIGIFSVKSTSQEQRSLGAGFEMIMGAGVFGALAFAVGVGGFISRLRLRRGLAAGTGLEVVVSENLLKITQPNQTPHFLLRRDVQVVLDLRRQVSLVHNEQQTVLTDALENWPELRERLLTWGPVERRSYAINWLWAMTPLTTLILSLATWLVDNRAESVAVALLSVAVGVALSARIGWSRILPRKQKILGILRSQLFALGALARLALYAKEALR